jgi:CRP/FNR family transcriptional regulator, cyclic AMP receptor protein
MASSQTVFAVQNALEDPLAHLPCSNIVAHRKGQLIYHQDQPSTSIYLVIEGRVKVARLANDGRQTIIDIYQTDDFFGESALLGLPRRPEQAAALENTKVMAWSAAEIDEIARTKPRLAIALLQIVVQRSLEYGHRIESFSMDNIGRRLARTLIRFSLRLGAGEPDGSYRMAPLTHELLAQYVGTSREIVTHNMNVFRRQGYLQYSRKGIVLYRDAFDEWLRRSSTHAVQARQAPRAASGETMETAVLKRA